MEGRDFHALVGILNTLSSLDNINLNVEEEQKEPENSSDPEEAKSEGNAVADDGTGNDPIVTAKDANTEVDVESVFEPIPEPGQRQTIVTSPVTWF
jgi:hypothetical protein